MRCDECKNRMRIEKWTYGEHGVDHEEQEGFACLGFAYEGVVIHLVGTEGCGCELFTPKDEVKKGYCLFEPIHGRYPNKSMCKDGCEKCEYWYDETWNKKETE